MDISNLAYAFINTPGVGGVVITLVFVTACSIYFFLTRWIIGSDDHPQDWSSQEHEG
jgi:hypothetical protein